jgi:hypothetical protein
MNICIVGLDIDSLDEEEDLAEIFLHLFSKVYREKTRRMNEEVDIKNSSMASKKGHVRHFTDSDFPTGLLPSFQLERSNLVTTGGHAARRGAGASPPPIVVIIMDVR